MGALKTYSMALRSDLRGWEPRTIKAPPVYRFGGISGLGGGLNRVKSPNQQGLSATGFGISTNKRKAIH